MPLTEAERQELAELEELDALETRFAGKGPGPAPAGERVYQMPAGPRQEGLVDNLQESLSDPANLKRAYVDGPQKHDRQLVAGLPPMVAPAGALPGVAAVMMRASRSIPGRVATGALQGAVTAPEGERAEGALTGGLIAGTAEAIPGGSYLAKKTPKEIKDAVKRAIGAAIGYRTGGGTGAIVGGIAGPAAAKLAQKVPAAATAAGRDPILRQKMIDAIRELRGAK